VIPARSDVLYFDEVEENSNERSNPTLLSLHFIHSALRRRWLVCVLLAVFGLLAATAFLVVSPQSHTAKMTLVLTHESGGGDTSLAMSTDVSLLQTRTVAAKTIENLGLTTTPEEFLKSVTVEPVGSELLSVTISAPSDAEAIRRLTTLNSVYLAFRGEQLTLQSNLLVAGMQQRIQELQGELAVQSRRIEQLAAAGGSSDSELGDSVEQRAYVQSQIDTLRQSVEDATLRNASIVSSSRVIDPPATDPGGLKRRIVLTLASGLIGGAALGCGTVLFFAVISDRLRRRADVAAALEVPVPISVGKMTPVSRRWLWLPHLRTVDAGRTNERQRLARAIEMELPTPRRSGRLAVVCIDNADEVRFAVATAATNLAADGCSVALLDLTKEGRLGPKVVSTTAGSSASPVVLRPHGIPTLASGAADLHVVEDQAENAPALSGTDVILVLADLDPSVGADYLVTWTDRVMIAVTSGRSSAEMVQTAADLVGTAGLELRIAALLRTERMDNSSGIAGFDGAVPVRLANAHQRPDLVSTSLDSEEPIVEEQAPTENQQVVALDEPLMAEEQIAGDARASDEEQSAAESTRSDDLIYGEDQTTAESTAIEQELVSTYEDTADELTSDQDEHTADELTSDQDEHTADELTSDQDEHTAKDEPSLEMAVVDLEAIEFQGQAIPHQDGGAFEAQSPAAFVLDGDPTVLMQIFDDEQGDEEKANDQPIGVNNPPADMRPRSEDNEFDWDWDWREDQPSEQDSDPSVRAEDGQEEPFSEAEEWVLYVEVYPTTASESAAGQQPAMNENWEWDETTVQNGSNDPVSELEAGVGEERGRPTSNGQASNGQGGHQDDAQNSEMGQQAHIDESSSRV
jgi:capsular polysaccharide biosynthesis protein